MADKRYTVPDKGSEATTIKTFMDAFFDHNSPARREWISEMLLAKMMIESDQWVEKEYNQRPGQAVRWTRQPDESVDEIPKPTTNEILPIFDGEVGRMRNRRSKPRVRARKNYDEASKAGAKHADEILEAYLDQIAWPRTRRRTIYRNVGFGTGFFKVWLEQSWLDTVKVGIAGAFRCIGATCGDLLASQEIEPEAVMGLPPDQAARLSKTETFVPSKGETQTSYQASNCLSCGAPMTPAAPGTPFGISDDEAKESDALGRPLGEDAPVNRPMLESASPFDMFLENDGVGVDPESITKIGQQTPRDLEWIATHYNLTWDENKKAYYKENEFGLPEYLIAEDSAILAEQHPILGEAAYGSGAAASTRNLYNNHVRLREFYSDPTRRHREGRAIHMAGNLVLLDGDRILESVDRPGVKFSRCGYYISRYWEKEGQLQGQGLCVPLFSPQRRINMTWSQVIATRERCAVAGIIAPRGARITSPGWMRSFPGHILYYELDPERPNVEPKPFPAQLMPQGVYEELNTTVDRMQYMVGVQDVDVGKAPSGVSAATAIKLLQDQSSQRREQRVEEFTDAEKAAWSHLILLIREFVREPRPYKFLSASTGKWEEDVYTGADLEGQTDIIVEEEPSFDDVAYERENVIQGLQTGVISPSTPYARYAIAKSLGLPADSLEEQNVQVEDALRKWYAFRDQTEIPSVDQFEDDHNTFWNVYGKEFKGDDGIRMKEECGWNELLKVIAGWDEKLAMAEAAEMQLKLLRQSIAAGQQQAMSPQIQAQLDAPPLPAAMEEKIFFVWKNMVQAKQQADLQQAVMQMQQAAMQGMMGPAPPPPPQFKLEHPFVRMKAVAEAHRKYDERKALAAQAVPTMAAPGANATPAGTQLTPNSPQIQGSYGQTAQQSAPVQ